jgi:hypothetical protein
MVSGLVLPHAAVHGSPLENMFGDAAGGSGLYYHCIIGGVEDSTVELSRDRDASEMKNGRVGAFVHIDTGYDDVVRVGVHTDGSVR